MSDLARELTKDHRPRKKKKQKPVNKGLLIGLIAGGSALVIGVVVLIIVLSSGGGGDKKKGDEPKKGFDPAYVRPLEEKEALAKLRQIGKVYHAYVDKNKGKGPEGKDKVPGKLDDLEDLDADLKKIVDPKDGWVELFYNWAPTLLPEGSSRTVVAQENQPFKGGYVVLFGDGSAKTLTEEELAKAPRAPKAKAFVPGPLVTEGGKTRLGKLRYVRPLNRLETDIILNNIKQSFLAFDLDKNRGPKELSDLDCARDPRVQEALDPKEGWLIFIWGVGQRNMADPPRTILGYEREPVEGMRYVIFGNGAPDRISEEDFAKAPRAK